jgi:hypothetical protein
MTTPIKFVAAVLLLAAAKSLSACEFCAIYNADNAVRQSGSGFWFNVSEQYIPYRTAQFNGEEVSGPNPNYVDKSITHLVPGYSFSPNFGISLNVPLTYINFRRHDIEYSRTALPQFITEKGNEFGLGDASLIARLTIFQKNAMEYGCTVTLLGAVKFPTGDSDRIADEVQQDKIFQSFLPPGTPHDPLGHSISSVHQHDLALGSGSFDGVFGMTANGRWKRYFLNAQVQYYLRTEGRSGFEYGDELMISGGPGGYVWLSESSTLSLQANAVYDTMARDSIDGRLSDRTGQTGWYLGPLLNFTWGERFSVNAGIDVPLHIENNGFQNVADYVLHGGLSWRF